MNPEQFAGLIRAALWDSHLISHGISEIGFAAGDAPRRLTTLTVTLLDGSQFLVQVEKTRDAEPYDADPQAVN